MELRDLPLLDRASRDGTLTWSRITALLSVIQRDTQSKWIEFAAAHSFRQIREETGCAEWRAHAVAHGCLAGCCGIGTDHR